jgi:hypothetical protein
MESCTIKFNTTKFPMPRWKFHISILISLRKLVSRYDPSRYAVLCFCIGPWAKINWMENFQTFLHFRNLKLCEHFNLPTCIQLEPFFIVRMLNIQCFMIHTHSVYKISSQDCHIICWSQNNYKVLQITLSEWLVITLLNIKYLNFLFNDEILSSRISHQ